MLARVKWKGDRYDAKHNSMWEYGTLLQIAAGGQGDLKAIIAWDGYNDETRGQLVDKRLHSVRVTTRYKWTGTTDE